MSSSSASNIAECVASSQVYEHQPQATQQTQHVTTKSSIGSAIAERFRRRPTSLHIPIPLPGIANIIGGSSGSSSKTSKTSQSSTDHQDDVSAGGGEDCSSSSSMSSIPSSSKAVATALSGLTPASSWYNNNGSDGETNSSSYRTASRCDSQPVGGRVSLSPSPCFARRSAAILSPLLNAATRAIGSDMEVFQLTTANPVKSTTTSMYYSSDLNLNIQIGDRDEIELVGRKGLVGQHTHLPQQQQQQLHSNSSNQRHIRHDSISHSQQQLMHSHLPTKGLFYTSDFI